jgi:hypothetical protein
VSPRRVSKDTVPRPVKRAEYEIVLITRQAEVGWRDALATYRNAVVDAWDRLCKDPTLEDGKRVYRLKHDLATGMYEGVAYERYQYKIPNGSRIWYFVDEAKNEKNKTNKNKKMSAGRVLIEDVHTAHPNETK